MIVKLNIVEEEIIKLGVVEEEIIRLGISDYVDGSRLDFFAGPYTVKSKLNEEQILETKNKAMRDDMTVGIIPRYEVPNGSSGITLVIGEE